MIEPGHRSCTNGNGMIVSGHTAAEAEPRRASKLSDLSRYTVPVGVKAHRRSLPAPLHLRMERRRRLPHRLDQAHILAPRTLPGRQRGKGVLMALHGGGRQIPDCPAVEGEARGHPWARAALRVFGLAVVNAPRLCHACVRVPHDVAARFDLGCGSEEEEESVRGQGVGETEGEGMRACVRVCMRRVGGCRVSHECTSRHLVAGRYCVRA